MCVGVGVGVCARFPTQVLKSGKGLEFNSGHTRPVNGWENFRVSGMN